MPEPVGSRSPATYQEPVDAASSAPPPAAPPSRPVSPAAPATSTQATQQLVNTHSLLPKPSAACVDRAADAAVGAGGLIAAAGVLIASGAIGTVGAFIGASIAFSAKLAQYYNCEVDASAGKAKAK